MSENPRNWTDHEVDRFACNASTQETVATLLRLAETPDDEALRMLRRFLVARHASPLLEHMPSAAAVHVLISLGEPGVAVLRDVLVDPPDPEYRQTTWIMAALYQASRGASMPWPGIVSPSRALESLEVTPEARGAAAQALRDIVADCLIDPALFDTVTTFIQRAYVLSDRSLSGLGQIDSRQFTRDVLQLLAESSIRLSRSLIAKYERLLDDHGNEESYQRFLAQHPVFLDPLSDLVVPKQRLGSEFATDYAIRRLDGRWLLVEIEKPHDPIFTRAYDFTAQFTHAFGQVLDFQSWVDEHIAYAQHQMEGIMVPRGLLVIGMRSNLDQRAEAKLRHYVQNSARIDAMTFDDLLIGAQNLYAKLHDATDDDAPSTDV